MVRQLLTDIKDFLENNSSEESAALIDRINSEQDFFIVTRLHRDDVLFQGVDVSKMDEDDMARLASKMSDDYCEQLFHLQIPIICESMGFGRFQCPNCPGEAESCVLDGNCYCHKCHYEWNIHKIPECLEGTYVLVEHPEVSTYFEENEIGYPSFNSEDNGARYVPIADYHEHFGKIPKRETVYTIQTWPESQKYFESDESQLCFCEAILADEKALEDFGTSAMWVPLCLLNCKDTTLSADKIVKARLEHAALIAEADADPDKWYELFVNEGEEGTHTVDSGDTFDEAVAKYEKYVIEYGAGNVFLDIWENRENPEQTQHTNLL